MFKRNGVNITITSVFFTAKPEGKRLLWRSKHEWSNRIKCVDWIQLTQDTIQWRVLMNTVVNRRVA